MTDATLRQKQFLRRLGHKEVSKLTKAQASQLIDSLLADEKAFGKTFPCPYCKARFGPRPKREKKCPVCGNMIIQLCGKFYTEEQADNLYQKDWLKESRDDNRLNVRDDWKDERAFRRQFKEQVTVGYLTKAGKSCPHAKHVDGLLVLIEDAFDTPELLPPFDDCRHDTCECEYTPVSSHEMPRGTRVAEFVDPKIKAKQTTRRTLPVSSQKKSGCASVLLLCMVLLVDVVAAW
jgi:hypothetical protein